MDIPKDLYEYLTNFADDRTILSMLSTNKQFRDENFFRRVVERKYPNTIQYKEADQSWKQFYIETVYYVERIYELIGYKYSKTAGRSPKVYYDFIKASVGDINKLLRGAIIEKDIDFVKFLVDRGASPGEWIHSAATTSTTEILDYLIKKGANFRRMGDGPLLDAVTYGNYDNVKYLIEHGANIHTKDDWPIYLAARFGHLNILKYLIEKGANVDKDKLIKVAREYGKEEIVKYLENLK